MTPVLQWETGDHTNYNLLKLSKLLNLNSTATFKLNFNTTSRLTIMTLTIMLSTQRIEAIYGQISSVGHWNDLRQTDVGLSLVIQSRSITTFAVVISPPSSPCSSLTTHVLFSPRQTTAHTRAWTTAMLETTEIPTDVYNSLRPQQSLNYCRCQWGHTKIKKLKQL